MKMAVCDGVVCIQEYEDLVAGYTHKQTKILIDELANVARSCEQKEILCTSEYLTRLIYLCNFDLKKVCKKLTKEISEKKRAKRNI